MSRSGLKAKAGDFFKVKATPHLRQYGVRTSGRWQARGDDRAWPGEVGQIVEVTWTWTCSMCAGCSGGPSPDCEQCHGKGSGESAMLVLDFGRGRSVSVDTADPADFIKVKAPSCKV